MPTLSGKLIRLACNQSSASPTLDVLTGLAPVIWQGAQANLQCALFTDDPASTTYVTDVSNIVSVNLLVREVNERGTLLLTKTIPSGAGIVASSYAAWIALTGQQFTFALSSVDTNQTVKSDGTLRLYFSISVTTASTTFVVGQGTAEIVDVGIVDVADPVAPTFFPVVVDGDGLVQNILPTDFPTDQLLVGGVAVTAGAGSGTVTSIGSFESGGIAVFDDISGNVIRQGTAGEVFDFDDPVASFLPAYDFGATSWAEIGVGTTGQVLTSNGTSSIPSFQDSSADLSNYLTLDGDGQNVIVNGDALGDWFGATGQNIANLFTGATAATFGAINSNTIGAGSTSGTNTGDQTITLTGNVTGSGTGSFAATIANSAVTLAKMADMATSSLIYRKTAGTGAPEVNTLATLKTDLGLSGTNSGDQTTISGNAATATALATARSIYGNNFDGSVALAQIIASTFGGTGNGFTKFSGPTTSEKTFTLPNASAAVLTDNAAVTTAQGGTGIASYVVGDLIYASAPTTLSKLADVAIGSVLISGGVTTAPAWSTTPTFTGTNVTGLPISTGVSGLGSSVAAALALNFNSGNTGSFLAWNGLAGTPASINLTNGTSLPVTGITASTSTALGIGSIELGHASDTTIARSGSGAITVEGTQVLLSGAPLGTPSSGTVTNLTGTATININGTVGAGTPNTGAFTTLSNTGAATNSKSGAASTSALTISGVPFAGTGTTSFPLLYINDTNATASTTLSTAGTYFGVNGDGTQDLMALLKDGTMLVRAFSTGGTVFGSTAIDPGAGKINTSSTYATAFVGLNAVTNLTNINFQLDNTNGFYMVSDMAIHWNSLAHGANGIFSGGTDDTRLSRKSAGVLQAGTTASNALGSFQGTFIADGTATTCTGATIGTGSKNNAGSVTATTTGTSTIVITFSVTAPTGWNIVASDSTAVTNMVQIASTTTTATLSGTTVSGDVIRYSAMAY